MELPHRRDAGDFLQPHPVSVLFPKLSEASPKHTGGVAQFHHPGMSIREIKHIGTIVPRSGKAGEDLAVVHRHEEEAVIDRVGMFIREHPQRCSAGPREFVILQESAVPSRIVGCFHIARPHKTIH